MSEFAKESKIMKKWEINFEGNNICVENKWNSEKLYINGKLHDEGIGLTDRAKLIGKLPDGKLVKVCLGGYWGIHCLIFVDDEEILRD